MGFQYSLDRSTFSSCTTPFTTNQLKAGVQHIFKVCAINSLGNKDATPATFTWSVLTPAQGIKNLESLVKSMHLDHGIQNALIAKLDAALRSLNQKHKSNSACGQLNAFINQVQGLSGTGQISLSQALQLINYNVVNETGRESGLTINVWEYSNVTLDMAKMIFDLDDKKEKEFRDSIVKVKGFHKGKSNQRGNRRLD